MKKFLKAFLCIMLAACIGFPCGITGVFAAPVSYLVDYDNLKIGETQFGLTYNGKNTDVEGALIDVDPIDSGNKALKIYNDGSDDKYLSLKGDYSNKTHIKFKFYNPNGNSGRMYFRDSISTANNLETFKFQGNKITAAGITVTYDATKWITIEIVMDLKHDYISLYTDAKNGYNGIVSLEKEAKPSVLFKKYAEHTIDNTTMRFGLMRSAGCIYVDDFEIVQNLAIDNNLFVRNINARKYILGEFDNISILRDGLYEFSSDVECIGDKGSASIVAAVYNKDGLMKAASQSDTYSFKAGETKKVKTTLEIPKLSEGDYVKMFLFDSKENIRPIADVYDLNQAEAYFRPSAKEILSDFYDNHADKKAHPRVVRTAEEFESLRTYLKTDSDFKAMFDKVKSETSLTPTLPQYVYDARNTILSESRRAMNGILPLAFLYQMSETEADKTKYANAVWRIASVVCDKEQFPDWNPQNHYLDTGEMGLAVAIAYDWCYDYWTDEQKQILVTALYDNIVEISLGVFENKYTYSGLKAYTNWNPVCNGSSITAAAAIIDIYPEECSKLISHSTKALEICLTDYAPKGGYSESPTYWAYGTTYLMWCMSTLDSLCGRSYGVENAPGLSSTGYFPAYATGPTGNWNYHDGGTGILDTTLSMFFAVFKTSSLKYNVSLIPFGI